MIMISEKISAKKNSKRERIIEAASILFSEKSFHEVMMTDVASKASIAKGTLYNYYNSKEDLYFSVMLIRMENLISSLKKKIQNEDTALTSLHTFIIHNYMFMMKYQCFFLMYQRENLNASNLICDELRNKNTELREILLNIICDGIKEQYFRNVDQEIITDLIIGGIFAAVNKGISKNYNNDLQVDAREKIYNFIINGLLNGTGMKQKRILITRSEEEAEDFTTQLNGKNIIYLPALEVFPIKNKDLVEEVTSALSETDYLILTSANAVKVLADMLLANNSFPDFSKITVAAVGNKTAEICSKYLLPVNLVPENFSAEGLINLFSSIDLQGKKVLIPGSALSADTLPDYFNKAGAQVKVISLYDVRIPDAQKYKNIIDNIVAEKPDVFVFTSPSSFRNSLQLLSIGNPIVYFQDCIIAAIGNTTKAEIEQHNIKVHILPRENTLEGLGRAISQYINQNTL